MRVMGTMRKITQAKTVKLNAYRVISDAIERGIMYGYRRAHKHTDEPSEDVVCEEMKNGIMIELAEVIEWD